MTAADRSGPAAIRQSPTGQSPTGLFISFEGIDGSGKSTQVKLLAEHFRDAVVTREPGGSAGAEEIRTLLLTGDPDRWSPETEILLFTAARRDHLEKTIRPALAAGKTVICDRFADSTRVYQGATRGGLRSTVDTLHKIMIAQEPDLTFIIDMDPQAALTRGLARGSGEDRFEDMGVAFQETLRHEFLTLAKANTERCVLIDGNRDPQAIAAEINAHVANRVSDRVGDA